MIKKPRRAARSRVRGKARRQEVRMQVHRANVPRSSKRPVERSKQRRSKRP